MADRTEARTRRTAARDRRRSTATEPSEDKDQAVGDQAEQATSQANGQLAGAAAKVVGTAVAAGFLGALGGAAKTLLERRGQESPSMHEGDGGEDAEPEAPAGQGRSTSEYEDDEEEPVSLAEEAAAGEDEQPEPEAVEERASASREGDPEGKSRERAQGVSGDEAAKIVASARRQLEGLLGTEAERVSGFERADGSWYVMLEVVEVSRVPESTDVMATYELVLDDERNLVSANRRRRYRRSQIDEAS
jgi:Gas vesicle synthesis protein GvpO